MGTVAIVEYAHGGTTMLAGICEILGVPMTGDNCKTLKWEDRDVVAAFKDEGVFKTLVEQRNRQHEIWGFKSPGAWLHADLLKRYLEAPVYLAIFKDPVSVTYRRFGIVSMNKLCDTIDQMKRVADGMRISGLAVHMLSYQKAISAPTEFVVRVAALIGIEASDRRIEDAAGFIRPNGQLLRNTYPSVGKYLSGVSWT